jgi:hypothetical protein
MGGRSSKIIQLEAVDTIKYNPAYTFEEFQKIRTTTKCKEWKAKLFIVVATEEGANQVKSHCGKVGMVVMVDRDIHGLLLKVANASAAEAEIDVSGVRLQLDIKLMFWLGDCILRKLLATPHLTLKIKSGWSDIDHLLLGSILNHLKATNNSFRSIDVSRCNLSNSSQERSGTASSSQTQVHSDDVYTFIDNLDDDKLIDLANSASKRVFVLCSVNSCKNPGSTIVNNRSESIEVKIVAHLSFNDLYICVTAAVIEQKIALFKGRDTLGGIATDLLEILSGILQRLGAQALTLMCYEEYLGKDIINNSDNISNSPLKIMFIKAEVVALFDDDFTVANSPETVVTLISPSQCTPVIVRQSRVNAEGCILNAITNTDFYTYLNKIREVVEKREGNATIGASLNMFEDIENIAERICLFIHRLVAGTKCKTFALTMPTNYANKCITFYNKLKVSVANANCKPEFKNIELRQNSQQALTKAVVGAATKAVVVLRAAASNAITSKASTSKASNAITSKASNAITSKASNAITSKASTSKASNASNAIASKASTSKASTSKASNAIQGPNKAGTSKANANPHATLHTGNLAAIRRGPNVNATATPHTKQITKPIFKIEYVDSLIAKLKTLNQHSNVHIVLKDSISDEILTTLGIELKSLNFSKLTFTGHKYQLAKIGQSMNTSATGSSGVPGSSGGPGSSGVPGSSGGPGSSGSSGGPGSSGSSSGPVYPDDPGDPEDPDDPDDPDDPEDPGDPEIIIEFGKKAVKGPSYNPIHKNSYNKPIKPESSFDFTEKQQMILHKVAGVEYKPQQKFTHTVHKVISGYPQKHRK